MFGSICIKRNWQLGSFKAVPRQSFFLSEYFETLILGKKNLSIYSSWDFKTCISKQFGSCSWFYKFSLKSNASQEFVDSRKLINFFSKEFKMNCYILSIKTFGCIHMLMNYLYINFLLHCKPWIYFVLRLYQLQCTL